MAMALTLHQLGLPCVVLESVTNLRPLGVGINLQPNAVRELYDLGLNEAELDRIGVQAREWALVGLNGNDVYSEPRGLEAGYNWPQYAVHRGELQMLDSRNEGSSRGGGGGDYDQSGGSDFGRSSPMQTSGGGSRSPAPAQSGGGGFSRDLDDEIPF